MVGRPTHCQHETREMTISDETGLAQPGQRQLLQAHASENLVDGAPLRIEDQAPEKADHQDGERGRDKNDRAQRAGAADAGGEQRGKEQAQRVLHQHVNGEKDDGVAQRIEEAVAPERVREELNVVFEPDKAVRAQAGTLVKAEPQRVDQGKGHEADIDHQGRQQEEDPGRTLAAGVPLESAAAGGRSVWSSWREDP